MSFEALFICLLGHPAYAGSGINPDIHMLKTSFFNQFN